MKGVIQLCVTHKSAAKIFPISYELSMIGLYDL